MDLDALATAARGIDQARQAWSEIVPLNGGVEASWGVGLQEGISEYADEQVLGHAGLAQTLSQFAEAWSGPLGSRQRALGEAEEHVRAAAETYRRADEHVEQDLRRIEQQRGGAGGHQ